MNHWDILQKTVADFFKIEPTAISFSTSANDIKDWDSFTHMELMAEIERVFQVTFPFDILMEFSNLGDVLTYLKTKD